MNLPISWSRFLLASFSRFLPAPPLAAFIEAYYFSEAEAPAQPGKERCLPNGQIAIVINLGHEMLRVAHQPADQLQCFRGGVLHGAFSQCSVIDRCGMSSFLGELSTTIMTVPVAGGNTGSTRRADAPELLHRSEFSSHLLNL